MNNCVLTFLAFTRHWPLPVFCLVLLTGAGSVYADVLDELIFVREFGSRGTQAGQFNTPWDIAIDSQDRVAVSDFYNHRIQLCDEFGSCEIIGTEGNQIGQFRNPTGIAVNSEDEVVIADKYNNRVQLCTADGNCRVLANESGEAFTFDRPQDVAVDSTNRIIVTEPDRQSYHVCIEGGQCTTFSDIDGEPNLFNRPENVAVDHEDNLVFMTSFDEVWFCDIEGNCNKGFGARGKDPGEFSSPQGILVDSKDRIVIADRGNWRIQICERSGECDAFDIHKTAPQLFWWPSGIALDSEGRLFASDLEGRHIQIYQIIQIEAPAIPVNYSMSDAWFDPDLPGQGFFINVFDELTKVMFVAWFTFDTERPDATVNAIIGEPGHRWLTAQGIYHTYTATLDLYLREGGLFLEGNPEPGQMKYGEMNIRFSDCGHGTVSFEIPSLNRQGVIEIERLAADSEDLCEALP